MRPLSVLAGAAAAAGAVLWFRRRSAASEERVDLYYEDGSMVTPADDAPEAERILVLARDAVRAVRGA